MSHTPSRSRSRRLWMVAWLVVLSGWFGSAASQQFSFRQYAQSDGLTNLAAGYLLADPAGDLWVGTDGGLFRFDGTAFVPYDTALGVPSETVRGLAMDPWERLWVTLDRGAISVAEGADRADCILETDNRTFERLVDGTLTATTALLRGSVTAEGAVDLLLYFQRLLPSPPPHLHDQLHAAQERA